MKTSIWIETLKKNHIEVFNTVESIFETAESSKLNIEGLNNYDVILYNAKKNLLSVSDVMIIYKSDNKEHSEKIIKFIQNKLNEKSELLQELQALKKIKGVSMEQIISQLKKNLHDNFYEFKIKEIIDWELD